MGDLTKAWLFRAPHFVGLTSKPWQRCPKAANLSVARLPRSLAASCRPRGELGRAVLQSIVST